MPRTEVDTGLPDVAPIAWAVRAGGQLWTAHLPIRPDGTFETGTAETQARLTFDNLRRAVEAAGGSLADIVQVVIHLVDVTDAADVSRVWCEYFTAPYPNRAIVGTSALTVPGVGIELTAVAVLPS
jgi:2-iminobutanoate/2-iminopropanoate deaminase